MTFSIAARCSQTGRFGIAVSSSSPAVAARCAHVRAGIGGACTQNITDPRLGPATLDLMALGIPAQTALDRLADSRPHIDFRQLTAIGPTGPGGIFSGTRVLDTHATAAGEDCVAAGNMLANSGVPAAMVSAFEHADGELGARLIVALTAGLAAGGEAGPVRSAGLLVASTETWPETDLRVDWDEIDPVAQLSELWGIWAPQAADYVTRALDPAAAPGYQELI